MWISARLAAIAGLCAAAIAHPVAAADQPDFNRPQSVYSSMENIADKCLESGNSTCALVCEQMQKTLLDLYSSITGRYQLSASASLPQISFQMQQIWGNCRQQLR
ncbi:hypothetical protein [Magnetospirillum sp. 15-1]|uniref:hypothetical protein n=1 Tax=Magnetospirillum sp. 15-1 TaxID=1979370 RepID=UPI00114273CC|nr:hypothetical protein [Magnetospirillum sp. 15-1]